MPEYVLHFLHLQFHRFEEKNARSHVSEIHPNRDPRVKHESVSICLIPFTRVGINGWDEHIEGWYSAYDS